MTDRPTKRGFAARPSDPEDWIKAAARAEAKRPDYSARLTVDITPDLPGRIKIAAFERGVPVADMLRELLAPAFPQPAGAQPTPAHPSRTLRATTPVQDHPPK